MYETKKKKKEQSETAVESHNLPGGRPASGGHLLVLRGLPSLDKGYELGCRGVGLSSHHGPQTPQALLWLQSGLPGAPAGGRRGGCYR